VLDVVLLAGPLALFSAFWVVLLVRRRGVKRPRARTSVSASSTARLLLGFALALAVALVGIAVGELGFIALGAATAAIQLVLLLVLLAARRLDRTARP
jgi:hypothetical protein